MKAILLAYYLVDQDDGGGVLGGLILLALVFVVSTVATIIGAIRSSIRRKLKVPKAVAQIESAATLYLESVGAHNYTLSKVRDVLRYLDTVSKPSSETLDWAAYEIRFLTDEEVRGIGAGLTTGDGSNLWGEIMLRWRIHHRVYVKEKEFGEIVDKHMPTMPQHKMGPNELDRWLRTHEPEARRKAKEEISARERTW